MVGIRTLSALCFVYFLVSAAPSACKGDEFDSSSASSPDSADVRWQKRRDREFDSKRLQEFHGYRGTLADCPLPQQCSQAELSPPSSASESTHGDGQVSGRVRRRERIKGSVDPTQRDAFRAWALVNGNQLTFA